MDGEGDHASGEPYQLLSEAPGDHESGHVYHKAGSDDADVQVATATKSMNIPQTYAVTINYIIGTGVFSLPYAVAQSGLGLGFICLGLSVVFSYLCIMYVLEFLGRSEGVLKIREETRSRKTSEYQNRPDSLALEAPSFFIGKRVFTYTSVSSLFAGAWGKYSSQIVMTCYCYGVLWSYVAVFASSVSSLWWSFVWNSHCDVTDHPSTGCQNTYYILVAVYSCIVVPFACLDVSEQAWAQTILTCFRFVAFATMLVSSTTAIFLVPEGVEALWKRQTDNLFMFKGFGQIFASAAVGLCFHYNFPDVAAPLKNKSKMAFHGITVSALVTAISFYIVLSLSCTTLFHEDTKSLVTLNWEKYDGKGTFTETEISKKPWWAIAVQLIVMTFPPVDMLSVFPLIAISLSNNLNDCLPKLTCGLGVDSKVRKVLCRLTAALPPVVLGMFLNNLADIFKFTGLLAFFLQFFIPCGLQLLTSYYCKKMWGIWRTPYSTHFSHPVYVITAILFGAVAFVVAVVVTIMDLTGANK